MKSTKRSVRGERTRRPTRSEAPVPSRTAQIIALLQQPGGASLQALVPYA